MNLKTISAIGLLQQALDTLPPDAFPEYRDRIRRMVQEAGDVLAPEDLTYESDHDLDIPTREKAEETTAA